MSRLLWAAGAPVRALLIGMIRAYRAVFRGALGGRCRFHPSCSAYAEAAVRTHGAGKGVLLAAWRLLRCSPLSPGGLDPVPPHGRWRSYDGVSRERA